MEKISVIMSVYKESKQELKQSIESILKQTHTNIEFIIIVDNPEQATIQFIKRYKDERIKLIINDENIGLVKSLNKALKFATGDYIARMDADDISILNRFEVQLNFLKKTNYDLCGSYVQHFYKNEDQAIMFAPIMPKNVKKILKNHNSVSHPTWLAKKEVFIKNKGYREIFACEDYDFLIRATINGFKISNVPEILLKYRLSESSISRTNAGKQELIMEYLSENFKKENIVSIEAVNEYIQSSRFEKKLVSYDKYNSLKIKKSKCVSDKFPMYYLYTILLCCNFRYALKKIKNKIIFKSVIFMEKRLWNKN